jgi:nucleoid DNA-binding protein
MTLTKRDLVVQITEEINKEQDRLDREGQAQQKLARPGPGKKKAERVPLAQQQVFDIVQRTLNSIAGALAKGQKVELRNFGIFEVRVRKARTGRNPNAPSTDVPIPARAVVKFKAGKEMRTEVLKLTAKVAPKSPARPGAA